MQKGNSTPQPPRGSLSYMLTAASAFFTKLSGEPDRISALREELAKQNASAATAIRRADATIAESDRAIKASEELLRETQLRRTSGPE